MVILQIKYNAIDGCYPRMVGQSGETPVLFHTDAISTSYHTVVDPEESGSP